jgi:hypothetical protein
MRPHGRVSSPPILPLDVRARVRVLEKGLCDKEERERKLFSCVNWSCTTDTKVDSGKEGCDSSHLAGQ